MWLVVGGGVRLKLCGQLQHEKFFVHPNPDLIGERNLRWLKILWCGYPCTVLVHSTSSYYCTVLLYEYWYGMVWYGMVYYGYPVLVILEYMCSVHVVTQAKHFITRVDLYNYS